MTIAADKTSGYRFGWNGRPFVPEEELDLRLGFEQYLAKLPERDRDVITLTLAADRAVFPNASLHIQRELHKVAATLGVQLDIRHLRTIGGKLVTVTGC